MKVSSELVQDRRAWSASIRDVVNEIGDAGSTRPGVLRAQVMDFVQLWTAGLRLCTTEKELGEHS